MSVLRGVGEVPLSFLRTRFTTAFFQQVGNWQEERDKLKRKARKGRKRDSFVGIISLEENLLGRRLITAATED